MSTRVTSLGGSTSAQATSRRRGSRRSSVALVALAALLLVVGSAVSTDTVTAAIGSTVTVTDRVSPADVTITAGDSVLFVGQSTLASPIGGWAVGRVIHLIPEGSFREELAAAVKQYQQQLLK